MFFNSIKEINRLVVEIIRLLKGINSLLSIGMSNIYIKVTIWKKWNTQNVDLLSLKGLSQGQFCRAFSLNF